MLIADLRLRTFGVIGSLLVAFALFFGGIFSETGSVLAAGQDGAVASPFKSGTERQNQVDKIVVQPDGKVLIADNYLEVNSIIYHQVSRLLPNGSVDSTFNSGTGANSRITALAVQSDGKILIGGNFTAYNDVPILLFARLNADGSLDATFKTGIGPNNLIFSIVPLPDGKILISGDFNTYNNITRRGIARLNSDGTLDTTFTPPAEVYSNPGALALQSDGKILVAGFFTFDAGSPQYGLARLLSSGELDVSFNPGRDVNNSILSIAIQPDGKILVGGTFTGYNNSTQNRLVRLNIDGTLDSAFYSGPGADGSVESVVVQDDGKIVIGGSFKKFNRTVTFGLAYLYSIGTVEGAFNSEADIGSVTFTLAKQADQKVLVSRSRGGYSASQYVLSRLNTDRTIDESFVEGYRGADNTVYALVTQPDGKILIGGRFSSYNGASRNKIARLNSDGSLDESFTPGTGTNSEIRAIALQPDGKILIAGDFTSYNGANRNKIARLNPDGSLDSSFKLEGWDALIYAVALQPDGKILIAGDAFVFEGIATKKIARLNLDGSPDTSFNPGAGANNSIYAITLQPDGKILIGGEFTSFNQIARNKIARLNSDGSLDESFYPGTGADNEVEALALQSDGKILIGGFFSSYNGVSRKKIARLNPDGSLDSSFVTSPDKYTEVKAIKIQADGRIILGGIFSVYNGFGQNNIVRLYADGSTDFIFKARSGTNAIVQALAIESSGNILLGGDFTIIDAVNRNRVARLVATTLTPTGLSLEANPNPANLGQNITFTVTLTPRAATGTVTFVLTAANFIHVPVENGQAILVTNTLPAGLQQIKAIYNGDANFVYNSTVYQQMVIPPCLVVTIPEDDGQASNCGTFSAALANAAPGLTITFALNNSQVTLNGPLTPIVKAGAIIDGGENGVVINGNGVAGDGLRLAGSNTLHNLTIKGFARQEIIALGSGNHFSKVHVIP